MKKCVFSGMIIFTFMLLFGCNGTPNNALDGKISDNKRWTETTYDMLFDFSNSYDEFENSRTIMAGRLITSDCELVFNVTFDLSGNLFFVPLRNANIQDCYFEGRFQSADENTYSVKVHYSRIPEIISDGTILTFTIDDIAAEDIYISESLGERTGGHGDGSRPLKK